MTAYRSVAALAALAALVCLAPSSTVLAHTNEYLATTTGPHGGMVRMSGPYHFELAVDDGEVRVWVTDHADNPQPIAGAGGQVMVMQGGERFVVELAPDRDNLLLGADERIAAEVDLRAVLTVRMQGEQPRLTRFTTMAEDRPASQQNAHAGHHAHGGH